MREGESEGLKKKVPLFCLFSSSVSFICDVSSYPTQQKKAPIRVGDLVDICVTAPPAASSGRQLKREMPSEGETVERDTTSSTVRHVAGVIREIAGDHVRVHVKVRGGREEIACYSLYS